MEEVQADPAANPKGLTNRERILEEYWQLRAALGMMGIDAWENSTTSRLVEQAKVNKVHDYLRVSEARGTLMP